MTQRDFARRRGAGLSTLSKWLRVENEPASGTVLTSGRLVPRSRRRQRFRPNDQFGRGQRPKSGLRQLQSLQGRKSVFGRVASPRRPRETWLASDGSASRPYLRWSLLYQKLICAPTPKMGRFEVDRRPGPSHAGPSFVAASMLDAAQAGKEVRIFDRNQIEKRRTGGQGAAAAEEED